MNFKNWKYYKHAALPTCAPHEEPDMESIENGTIWNGLGGGKKPFFARWTTGWDCAQETNWWYIVLDTPFNIMNINSHDRARIKTGLRNYNCHRISPSEYAEEMASITLMDWATYPKSYRPKTTKEELIRERLIHEFTNWPYITHGAFDKDGKLCAFHGIKDCGTYYQMAQGKSIPEKQKGQLNAALIYTYITDLSEDIKKGKYLTNGQRNLYHQTNFNNDLCRYYGFRKVYCHLHIKYNPKIKWIIKGLYPFRKVFMKLDKLNIFHSLNAVMKMEEICREDKNLKGNEQ